MKTYKEGTKVYAVDVRGGYVIAHRGKITKVFDHAYEISGCPLLYGKDWVTTEVDELGKIVAWFLEKGKKHERRSD